MLTMVDLLRRDLARHGGAADQLQDALASIWILVKGLQQAPPPRPLRELTGVHRRPYRAVHALHLHCAGVERWDTATGYHGFSVYFWTPEREEYLVWSEARQRELDPQWEPDAAIEHAQLGGIGLKALLGTPCRLETGWVSDDGRLSGRDVTRTGKPCADGGNPENGPTAVNLSGLIHRLACRTLEDPWQAQAPDLQRVGVADQTALQQDAAGRRWFLDVQDSAGNGMRLEGSLDGPEGIACKELARQQAAGKQLREVFGRLMIENGKLAMRPICASWQDHEQTCHLTVPWLQIDTTESERPGHA
jgi:hypothetical protein